MLAHVDFRTVQWGPSDLRNRIATASFLYEAAQNPSITFVPKAGDEVRVIDDDGTTTLFTGHISMIERGGDPVFRRYSIQCQDLNYLFDKLTFPGGLNLSAGVDGYMVQSVLDWSTNVPENTPLRVAIGIPQAAVYSASFALPAILTTEITARTAFDNIAALIGRPVVWFLDAARKFHWNDNGALASFALSTRPNVAGTTYMDGYSEFIDRTTHYHSIMVEGSNPGLWTRATDWVAYGDQQRVAVREADRPATSFVWLQPSIPASWGKSPRILAAAKLTDTALTTQAQVTRRAWSEIEKAKIRKTIRCTIYKPGLRAGMLIDVLHDTWGTADILPAAGIRRRTAHAHSSLKGELAVGARGRYLIQKVTPHVVAKGSPNLYAFDLELGDYEGGLETTLARSL